MSLPEQYKTKTAYFMDFEFKVSRDTFIPRPETELLVDMVVEAANQIGANRILDIGTGCGNIAISLTKYLAHSKIVALDISHKALLKAKENKDLISPLDRIAFLNSDLFTSLKKKRLFDVIVSNPPYISDLDMRSLPNEVLSEPHISLYGGEDGLSFYKRIIRVAKNYLRKKGFLLMEMGYNQSESIKKLLEKHCYINIEIFKDYSNIDRIIKAQV